MGRPSGTQPRIAKPRPGAGTGNDFLLSLDALTPGDPPNTGHYCNMHWPDGSWEFEWRGARPCKTLVDRKPGGTIVRARLYSTSDANAAMVMCTNGGIGPVGAPGAAPREALYNGVGHTTNSCIFSISMTALALVDQLFDPPPALGGASPFTHNTMPIALEPFGNGETGIALGIDRFGLDVHAQRELAYDHSIDEGWPVLAVAGGVVLDYGSRLRDVTGAACSGTPNQGELYIKYGIGSDPVYRESVVVYYAHARKRLVAAGQTVKPGQIVGYVGATGCAGSGVAHLHSGVYRITNVNAHDPSNLQIGYRVPFQANADGTGNSMGNLNSIDALGWANVHAFDPWAFAGWNTPTLYGFTGIGAWSVNLLRFGKAFRYP